MAAETLTLPAQPKLARRLAGMAKLVEVTAAEVGVVRYDFAKLGGHAGEQLLLEMLKAVRCDGDDRVYYALVTHIAAAERQRARARKLQSRRRREGDA